MKTLFSLVAASCIPAVATADVTGLLWQEIDNTIVDPTGDSAAAIWNSQPGGWRTFDLYALGAEGTRINGVNLGAASDPASDPYGIEVIGGTIFNYPPPAGGNVQSSFEGLPGFQLVQFDTYVDLGPLNPDGSDPAQISVVDMDLAGGADGVIRGSWFATSPTMPEIDETGLFRIMRLTVSSDTLSLDGSIAILLDDGEVVFSIVPPAPGAASLMLLAGGVAARRRR